MSRSHFSLKLFLVIHLCLHVEVLLLIWTLHRFLLVSLVARGSIALDLVGLKRHLLHACVLYLRVLHFWLLLLLVLDVEHFILILHLRYHVVCLLWPSVVRSLDAFLTTHVGMARDSLLAGVVVVHSWHLAWFGCVSVLVSSLHFAQVDTLPYAWYILLTCKLRSFSWVVEIEWLLVEFVSWHWLGHVDAVVVLALRVLFLLFFILIIIVHDLFLNLVVDLALVEDSRLVELDVLVRGSSLVIWVVVCCE